MGENISLENIATELTRCVTGNQKEKEYFRNTILKIIANSCVRYEQDNKFRKEEQQLLKELDGKKL